MADTDRRVMVRPAGNGIGVCRGSGLRGVRGESTAGSGEVGVGALIETNLSLT